MPPELPNKPLVEAIFELRWAPNELPVVGWKDPAYPLFIGPLFAAVKDQYGFIEELPATQIPDEMSAGVVKYRFRRAADDWPLIQAGPGVATLNFTTAYTWDDFHAAATAFLPNLINAYEMGGTYPTPRFTAALLRYINAIEVDPDRDDLLKYLDSHLHTSIELPNGITHDTQISGEPTALDLRLAFPLKDAMGSANLHIGRGRKNDRPAIIWDLSVRSHGTDMPQSATEINAWLARAHSLIESWFFTLIDGELLARFSGGTVATR